MTSRSPGASPFDRSGRIPSKCFPIEKVIGEVIGDLTEITGDATGQTLDDRVREESNGSNGARQAGVLPKLFLAEQARPPALVIGGADHRRSRCRMLLRIKRVMDLAIGIVALILTLPLWAAIAAAIRLDTPGPVLFRQERVTKGGAIFTMYKFRTMVDQSQSIASGDLLDRTVPFFKSHNDPQVTRVGRILRETSLDELPQLWNVIKGDMSMVGPRPLWRRQLMGQEAYGARHRMKAGLTGWWQINGRSHLDGQTALTLDLFYIDHWSLRFDLYILLRTIGAVLTRRGAY